MSAEMDAFDEIVLDVILLRRLVIVFVRGRFDFTIFSHVVDCDEEE